VLITRSAYFRDDDFAGALLAMHDGLTQTPPSARSWKASSAVIQRRLGFVGIVEEAPRIIMRTRTLDVLCVDYEINQRLALDIAGDEKAIIYDIVEFRRENPSSLAAIGFLVAADPSPIARCLNGT
jgi:hypothetical protein